MNTTDTLAQQAQAISELYQRAAQELLHAYQRNKEATRHHASGAYRAALHHARMSSTHSSAAHEYIQLALARSDHLPCGHGPQLAPASSVGLRRDH